MGKPYLASLQTQLLSCLFSPHKIDAAGDKHQLSKEGRRMERKHDPKKKKINKNCAGAGEQKAKLKVSRAPGRQGNEMWS